MDDQTFAKHKARFEEFGLLSCVTKSQFNNFVTYGFVPGRMAGKKLIIEFQNGLYDDELSRDQFLKEYERRVQPIR